MPHDPDGGEFVWINAESIGDSRLRQLPAGHHWLLHMIAMRAAEGGRRGWIPIEDGETAPDTLVRIYPPQAPEGPPSPAAAQAALDRFEHLSLIAVEPGRIRMTAPELFSYE